MRVVAIVLCFLILAGSSAAQTTEFTYQGNLKDGVNPANGNYDFEFRLFDALSGGAQVGSLLTRLNIPVSGGAFSVSLDFGNNFPGANRFLEVRVRNAGGTGYTVLDPRQKLASAPYSVKSLSTDNASQLGGVSASQYTLTTDPRLSDARNPLPNSSNYIQNTGIQQPASNFNISGNGTASGTLSAATVAATTQFNLNGGRLIHLGGNPLNENLFVGPGAGSTTTFCCNAFFGFNAGGAAISGAVRNSLFGHKAGEALTSGDGNSLFGNFAGKSMTNATGNTFFGNDAGRDQAAGGFNSYFGRAAGVLVTSGEFVSLFGDRAMAADGLTNATALGANAFVGQSNSLVLGDNANVGIGTSSPVEKLHVRANSSSIVFGDPGCTGFAAIGFVAPFGSCNNYALLGDGSDTMLNRPAGRLFFREGNVNQMTIASGGNVGIGTTAATDKLHIVDNGGSMLVGGAGCPTGSVSIGLNGAFGSCVNFTLRGSGDDIMINRPAGGEIFVREGNGTNQFRIRSGGVVQLPVLGTAGGSALCRNGTQDIAFCSSSRRYKYNIADFRAGLSLVERLRPVSFNWKDSGTPDMGLVAEDVAEVEPLLITYDDKGQIEGVKYDRVAVILLNAVKELQEQIKRQNDTIEVLKASLCDIQPTSAACGQWRK